VKTTVPETITMLLLLLIKNVNVVVGMVEGTIVVPMVVVVV
jgi:hypothetical protein